MNEKEAIATLTIIALGLGPRDSGSKLARESLMKAIEALRKQIPQNFAQKGLFVTCPRCKKSVLPTKYCPECGQAFMGTYLEKEG